ncbi:hypothetical protein C8B47_03290 [filamentous cyanobacterium CCP4]|nr:hypothetical protein C8B47_03290 [filamentous cyanobacterium CCP4]
MDNYTKTASHAAEALAWAEANMPSYPPESKAQVIAAMIQSMSLIDSKFTSARGDRSPARKDETGRLSSRNN